MYSDAAKLFDSLRQKVEESGNKSKGSFGNPNILKLKQGYSYKLRLLWIPPAEGVDRNYPMINQYVHTFWDDNAVGQKGITVYCKTSQYDEDETKAGWECPACKKASALYKEYQSGSASAKTLYDRARRSFRGYVPVYVIDGPEEDLHKIKILQYTKSFKDFFNENIFGWKPKNQQNNEESAPIDESEILGIEAFTYYEPKDNTIHTNAYNFLVTVGTRNVPVPGKDLVKMPDYKFKFSKNMSEIDFDGEPITVERYLGLSDEIGFDKDIMKKSTTEEIQEFVNKYIEAEPDDEVETEEVIPPTPSKLDKFKKPTAKTIQPPVPEEDDEDGAILPPPPKKSVTKKPEAEIEETDEPNVEEDSTDPDDIDIDDLLKGI